MRPVGEASDVADLGQQPRCTRGADAVQGQQGGVDLGQQRQQLLVRSLLAGIDPLEVHDQLHRDALAGLADDVPRTHRREQAACLGCGQVTLGAARNQFQHKGMQLVDLVRVFLADGATSVHQDP